MQFVTKWEYDQIKQEQPQLNHLLLQIQTPADVSQAKRQPLVVILALDKSWSMKGEKLDATLNAASVFINWLTRHDYVSILAYAADIQVIQPLVKLDEKKSIINRLQSIKPGTATNLSGGWLQALKLAQGADLENAVKRVILLTDGLATMGIQDDQQLFDVAKDHFQQGISTTTIGFGSDFNEETLQGIAQNGGGNFYFAESPEKISDIFFKEFGSIGNIFAQATELSVSIPPEARFLELLDDIPHDTDKNSIKVQLGDLRYDDVRNLLFAFEIDSKKKDKDMGKFTIDIDYYDIAEKPIAKKEQISTTLKVGKESSQPNNDVALQLLIAAAGRTMVDASKVAENDIEGAIEILENMIHRLNDNIDLAKDIIAPLVERIQSMQKHLREDSIMARKFLLASGSGIHSERADITVINDKKLHNKIFEHSWSGELDMYNCPDLKQIIKSKLSEGYRYIILDLSDTPFVDSSAIGTLIQISNWLTRRMGLLVVANLSSTVEKIFQMTYLNSYIPVSESVTGAKMLIESRQPST